MLQEFITSALIIDDKPNEIEKLKEHLEEMDIWVKHYTPNELDDNNTLKKPFNNRKLIFLDLYLKESENIENNVSRIRKYFADFIGLNFGTYGIVLWTKHVEDFKNFLMRIYKTDNKYTEPLFVVYLDKSEYIHNNDFNGVLEKLENILANDVSASFFIEWNKSVKKGSDNTITNLYSMFESNDRKNEYLEAVLFNLARNYTGLPINVTQKDKASSHEKEEIEENLKEYNSFLQKDLVNSLMDTLQVEISNKHNDIPNLFCDPEKLNYGNSEEKTSLFSKLNSFLLLDFQNLDQNTVVPGNIYKILSKKSSIYITDLIHNKKQVDIDSYLEINKKKENIKCKVNARIALEITPPCDFSNQKKQIQSRIIGGIILDYNLELKKEYFKGDSFYSFIHPIHVKGIDKPQMMIFDFYRFQTINEADLKDSKKYDIFGKAKDRLFADIQQKLSSHIARLGIAILDPSK